MPQLTAEEFSKLPSDTIFTLDTSVWLCASLGEGGLPVGEKVFADGILPLLNQAAQEKRLRVSAASGWEAALRVKAGLLSITDVESWIHEQSLPPGVQIVPISATLAAQAVDLPPTIPDTIDRFIVMTAWREKSVLLTLDQGLASTGSRTRLGIYYVGTQKRKRPALKNGDSLAKNSDIPEKKEKIRRISSLLSS